MCKNMDSFQDGEQILLFWIPDTHCLEHKNKTSPLFLHRTPIPAGPGFPLAASSTLNFKTPRGGGEEEITILSLDSPQDTHAFKLWMMLRGITFSNSSLIETHLAILKTIDDKIASEDIDERLKMQ